MLPHAYFKYDYDDIYNKQNVYIYKRKTLHIKVNNDNYSETEYLTNNILFNENNNVNTNNNNDNNRENTKNKIYSEPIQLYSNQNPIDKIKFRNFIKSNVIRPLL